MTRKTLRGPDRAAEPHVLKARVEQALQEGLHRNALDQARTLHEIAPDPEHRELLVRASLECAEQLLMANQQTQAATVASKAWILANSPADKERLADILARSGNLSKAWLLAEQVGEPALTARILGHAADNAIRNLPTLSSGIPAEFHAHKEAIQRAFAEVQAGNDEQARTTLQIIGLTSPFLEWKLLLRGFVAYYQNDDARAMENWQRLNAKRVPARLAAPFLQVVDPAFRGRQSPENLMRLQDLLDRVQGGGPVASLRTLRKHLANEKALAQAFRHVETILPKLRAEAPQLVQRIAGCFFWAIIDHGYPEDIRRYLHAFGAPEEDPPMSRLEALALEQRQDLQNAHMAWRDYEKELANHAAVLPPGHVDRMRSLVWQRMAANAAKLPNDDLRRRMRRMPLAMFDDMPRPLKPNAETCFKKSVELAPDQLEAHRVLVTHYLEVGKNSKALTAAKKLLKQFPDHNPTLELAGDLNLAKDKYVDAVKFLSRALHANPVDSNLREKVALAHAACAEQHASAKQLNKARQQFEQALALREGVNPVTILCPWAACEFLAGEDKRAEELLEQARAAQCHPLAIAFAMLNHAHRLNLPKPLKSRFEKDVTRLLKDVPVAAGALAVAILAAAFRQAGVKYTGQKTHQKKILTYLTQAADAELSETQLQQICAALADLGATKVLQVYAFQGQRRFSTNPRFYLAEADIYLSQSRSRIAATRAKGLLDKVSEMAARLPPVERDALLAQVQQREEKLNEMNPFARLFGGANAENIFGDFMGGFGGDFDDDFDDEDILGDDDW
ncbi:MAG TPA: hypothetical protein VE988_26890 [Gemmataceae bacterium]|nr:hypothetical protein [Gemmataceae bacterium]